MKRIDWSSEKSDLLKSKRNICFEDIINQIVEGKIIRSIEHPNKLRYGHQRIFIINWKDYIYLVPYIEDEEKIFLKTIIPSRKLTKLYIKKL